MAPESFQLYSVVIAVHPQVLESPADAYQDWRVGDITVDWVDFTREKTVDGMTKGPSMQSNHNGLGRKKGSSPSQAIPRQAGSHPKIQTAELTKRAGRTSVPPEDLSLQPLVGHFPGPNPLETSVASGLTNVGRGVLHLFRHAPPSTLVASLDAHPVGESSSSSKGNEWSGERAEGEDGSLVAILAVPAWMRPADFLEFIGGWATCLEGVRMIREASTPNRSLVLLKFRDPLQASDFLVIFTGRPFSTLDSRETCHPVKLHHLVLHHESPGTPPTAIPAFPPTVYNSRRLSSLLKGVPEDTIFELPSCPVCLERLDSSVTGLVTLPCAHTFDCDCLKKWGDSRCPVCRVSHLLLHSSTQQHGHEGDRNEVTRLSKCATCSTTSNCWVCVVCGQVGCGRYSPGKGHARRHWEESGHVLAMELETQRVWDYNGDNYVHRLIQTRTDGKLVELPSASSLVTSLPSRPLPFSSASTTPSRTNDRLTASPAASHRDGSDPESQAGPSSTDQEKMSTIEAITLEYSYLLSSQLEAMRQHYESLSGDQAEKLSAIRDLEARIESAEKNRIEADQAREKAEKRAEKAAGLTRSLQASLSAEKSMSEGMSARIHKLQEQMDKSEMERKERDDQIKSLEETVRDLMFSLEAGLKIQAAGGGEDTGEGGSLVVVPGKGDASGKGKKKGKK